MPSARPFSFDVGAEPNAVVTADVDDDGLPDLLTANTDAQSGGGSVTVLINDSVCIGDVAGNGNVGFDDLLLMISVWGPCPDGDCPADIDESGVVGFNDLTLLLNGWGPCAS